MKVQENMTGEPDKHEARATIEGALAAEINTEHARAYGKARETQTRRGRT